MLCFRITHASGLPDKDLLAALQRLAERKAFGSGKNQFTIGLTFTDIIATFEKNTNLPEQATTAASQITGFLELERANHPAKWIEDYKAEGPALRIPVLTSSIKRHYPSFPFKRGGLHIQLYQRAGDTAKYTDRKGYTVPTTGYLSPPHFRNSRNHVNTVEGKAMKVPPAGNGASFISQTRRQLDLGNP